MRVIAIVVPRLTATAGSLGRGLGMPNIDLKSLITALVPVVFYISFQHLTLFFSLLL